MSSSGYVRHFVACNRHDLTAYAPLFIGEHRYGYIKKDILPLLLRECDAFEATPDAVRLAPRFADFETRSAALARAADVLCRHYGKPLRHEMYAVIRDWKDTPVAKIDRVTVPWFGARAWGVHVNGFVRKADGIHLWIGERAADRPADPGKLDNMIGGGMPFGLSMEDNLCKEAKEEAGLDEALARTATFASSFGYLLERPEGLRSDSLFIYDLELPEGYTPRNTDGEVAAFTLRPLREIAQIIRDTDKFKFNCSLVIIDFMLRHGFLTPQDAEYTALQEWLARSRQLAE